MHPVPAAARTLPPFRLLTCGRVVTPEGVLSPGWIRLAGPLIDAVGFGHATDQLPLELPVTDLHGHWVLPGFVDLHVHGGGGTSFTEGTADDAGRAAEFHRGHGSTTIVASLVTAPLADLEARTTTLAGLVGQGVIAGIHLEGPFLSPVRCGAQDPRHMLAPDVAAFERLHAAAAGQLRVITIAPELPGASALIKAAARVGVTAAAGHSDATADITSAAVDAGVTHATHLFNGMRPLHHREPGPAGALLDRNEVTCEVIADGVHLHDTVIRLAARAAARAGPGHRRDGRRRDAGWQLPARVDAGRRGRGSGPPRRRRRARRDRRHRRLDRHHGRRRPACGRRGPAGNRGGRRGEHHPGPRARPRRSHRRPARGPGRRPGRLRRGVPAARGHAAGRVADRESFRPGRISSVRAPNQ